LQPADRLAGHLVVPAERGEGLDRGGRLVGVDGGLGVAVARGVGAVRGEGAVGALLAGQPVHGRLRRLHAGRVLGEQRQRLAPDAVVLRVAVAVQGGGEGLGRLGGRGRVGGGRGGGADHGDGGQDRGAAADVHDRRVPLSCDAGAGAGGRGDPGGSAPYTSTVPCSGGLPGTRAGHGPCGAFRLTVLGGRITVAGQRRNCTGFPPYGVKRRRH